MAVGSNTLGLLFKIGVDAKDAEQQVSGLKDIVSGVGDAFTKGLGEGAVKGAKDFEKAAQSAATSTRSLLTPLNEARRGFEEVFSGDAVEGTLNLTRAMGPLGIAIAGVAIAAAGVGFAIKGAIDAAEEIGTTSKDDFDALQKKVQSAGESITELQRGMAQGILEALDRISGATTAFFAKVLEKDGPALIALLNEVASFITDTLIPFVDKWGDRMSDAIARTIAVWRVLNKEFTLGDFVKGLPSLEEDFAKALADVRAEIAGMHPQASGLIDDQKKHAKALKDLTEAQLEQNRAQREFNEAQADATAQEAEINRQLKAGAITAEEAAGRRLAIQQNLKNAEDALLDAQQKRIDDDIKGDNRRTDAFEENASKRTIAETKAAADQAAINAQQEKDQIKQDEDRLKRLDEILKAQQKIGDAVLRGQVRAGEAIPGGDAGRVLGLPSDAEIDAALRKLFDKLKSAQQQFQNALKSSGGVLGDWHKLFSDVLDSINNQIIGLIAQGKGLAALGTFITQALPINALLAMNDALSELTLNLIRTGQTGPAVMKQFTAAVLRSLATLAQEFAAASFAAAIWFLIWQDYKDAALAFAAGIAFEAVAVGIGLAAGKISPAKSTASAAAGGGGFGGTDVAPGTVTVNQGVAATTLGIAAQQAALMTDMRNSLQNITTAPPGDVLQRGADQNPMVVGQANNEAARRDGTVSRQFLEIAGLRPA